MIDKASAKKFTQFKTITTVKASEIRWKKYK